MDGNCCGCGCASVDKGGGTPNLEGDIRVRLRIEGDRVAGVDVISTRRVEAGAILRGYEAEEALRLVPNLWAICGTAQGLAGLAACEAAAGLEPSRPHRQARRLLLLAETVREHAMRMILDWPHLCGRKLDPAPLLAVIRPLSRLPGLLYPAGDWSRPGGGHLACNRREMETVLEQVQAGIALVMAEADRMLTWVMSRGLAGFGASTVEPMPRVDLESLSRAMAEDRAFLARPSWRGRAYSTGPLARMRDHPLVRAQLERHGAGVGALLLARMVEFNSLPREMHACLRGLADDTGGSSSRLSGIGAGMIEAARGLLVHRVEVARGVIQDYRILAPTEWNFHPEGALVLGLTGSPAVDADSHARLLATALDPCVHFSVELVHA